VHRDLKPENVLYESNKPGSVIKVVDFGTSRVFDPSMKMNQKIGTVNTTFYLNCSLTTLPQKFSTRSTMRNVTFGHVESYFSFYFVAVLLLIYYNYLAPPFNGNDDYEILESVKRGTYTFNDDEWENVS
jgi:calcium-dependent protein kinase